MPFQMFQFEAGRHHDVNLLLHVLNSLLPFQVLKAATGFTGRSFMVAALFALNPINIEFVVWIAERKTASERNVLSIPELWDRQYPASDLGLSTSSPSQ